MNYIDQAADILRPVNAQLEGKLSAVRNSLTIIEGARIDSEACLLVARALSGAAQAAHESGLPQLRHQLRRAQRCMQLQAAREQRRFKLRVKRMH